MKKKVPAPTLFGIIIGLLSAMLIAVLLINIANAKEISELLNNGKKTEAEALIEKHPGCLNTRPAYAPRWLARFMDFPQSGYLLPDACSNGYYDTARRMVELGADPNKGSFLKPLGAVLQDKHAGCYDMAVWLYEHGAKAEVVTDPWSLPEYSAIWAIAYTRADEGCAEEESEKLFDYFYERIGNTIGTEDSRSTDDWPLIMLLCAGNGHSGIIERILDKALCDVNADSNGVTALMRAAASGDTEIVQLLLSRGADKTKVDKDGLTALQYAEKYCKNPEAVIRLLSE